MPSNTYLPSLDQGQLQKFQDNFYMLTQQKQSKMASSAAVFNVPFEGKVFNMARMGKLSGMTEVTGQRNPELQVEDYALDNRLMTNKRFTRTIRLDKLTDIDELIADPTSDLLTNLVALRNRTLDRIIVASAVGNVLVGSPDATPTSRTAAQDGVLTVAATSGVTYETIKTLRKNFVNNGLQDEDMTNCQLLITGSETFDLMGEVEFINNDFSNKGAVGMGYLPKVGPFDIIEFEGSESGNITVTNPILPEASGVRKCIALAPRSIAVATQIELTGPTKNPNYVNSWDITATLVIKSMRTEGVKVQVVTTTI